LFIPLHSQFISSEKNGSIEKIPKKKIPRIIPNPSNDANHTSQDANHSLRACASQVARCRLKGCQLGLEKSFSVPHDHGEKFMNLPSEMI
jgi:hypothetical protein